MLARVLLEYIDAHATWFGIEPICTVLTRAGARVSPTMYYAGKARAPSALSVSDATTLAWIVTIHANSTA